MLDINFIREQSEVVKESTRRKGMDVAIVDELLHVDEEYRETLQKVESLRAERNKITKETRERGSVIKKELQELEPKLKELSDTVMELAMQIPNLVHEDVPSGESEDDNVEHRIVGKVPHFDFKPKDHLEIAKNLDLIDFEAGAKVSGSQFYYLKNEAVLLELALAQYAMQELVKEGFTPMMTPDLARSRYYLGTGYLPKGDEAQTYVIDGEDLGLIATAEVTMAGYHADEVFSYRDLPKKYVAISHCYRQEAGAYGKFSKGLYRVHQFTKVEMFAFTLPEQSNEMHAHFLEMEEKLWQALGITYRVLEMCDKDLGGQAVRKYDLEAWMPGKGDTGDWGEVTSTSNTTDFQARRLNIKFKNKKGENEFVHTCNGTAFAMSRAPIAILENFQQKDGSVVVPEVLRPWLGKDVIGARRER